MYNCFTSMSLLTSLSIKEEHRNEYNSMRNWLRQRKISLGDYIIDRYKQEFHSKIETLTKI